MTEIWINEEKITEEFLKENGRHMKIIGKVKALYYIGDFAEGNHIDLNRSYLLEFLRKQNIFPLYFTFVYFLDDAEETISGLVDNNIPYSLSYLEETNTYYDLTGKHKYHPPCFSIEATDCRSVELVLNLTYWLAAQNEFYSISTAPNLSFQLVEVKEWGRIGKHSAAVYAADACITFITIDQDGRGFYLYSNDDKYRSVENLMENLPSGTTITQINDTLLNRII
ncbi:hypothetical protein [Planomicrobium sp. CPCC 101110]|uniref:hypothetical protein n=1 Tax=Planomicrobium sp. CPCC 101110 TaxID=2599619 RepID=UPI0011B7AE2F|nr:hypothetical protein [Planomicrobium sp. CPCC 101110]TWT25960.1 hypothetical protein FQV30_09215 [Planomicrobium sp. CPCC 101110]